MSQNAILLDYAQKLADLTGRPVCCAPVTKMPRTDFDIANMTAEDFNEMTEDFLDSLGPIVRVEPKEKGNELDNS